MKLSYSQLIRGSIIVGVNSAALFGQINQISEKTHWALLQSKVIGYNHHITKHS